MDHKTNLSGLYPPATTPFREDQRVDYEALAFNIEQYNQTGLKGYMPLGSNGEFRALSDAEALEILAVYRKKAGKDKLIMAGAMRDSAYATVEFIKQAAELGVHYASVLTPYYFAGKMDDDALAEFYSYVADRAPIPVLLYCAPKFAAGVAVTPELVARLCEHPNIVGMKDTSANDIRIYLDAVKPGADFHVLSGSIGKYLYGLEIGAVGGVLSPLDYLPEACLRLEQLHRAGRADEAKALSDQLIAFNKSGPGRFGVAGVKAAMDLLGYKGGVPRNPVFPLDGEKVEIIRRACREAGYLP